ncbi:hypothetical protein GQ53DRAFT_96862 [Thozetella sp. PMI_491]|nr:hypothetical protein GQ53DRAFT_96862 [Thozetella sp. PMI_491]
MQGIYLPIMFYSGALVDGQPRTDDALIGIMPRRRVRPSGIRPYLDGSIASTPRLPCNGRRATSLKSWLRFRFFGDRLHLEPAAGLWWRARNKTPDFPRLAAFLYSVLLRPPCPHLFLCPFPAPARWPPGAPPPPLWLCPVLRRWYKSPKRQARTLVPRLPRLASLPGHFSFAVGVAGCCPPPTTRRSVPGAGGANPVLVRHRRWVLPISLAVTSCLYPRMFIPTMHIAGLPLSPLGPNVSA